jgi:hypothetical protein
LAEVCKFGGTKRSHLLDALDKLERLIQESANSAKPLVICRDFASLGRAITNSHTWLEDIVDAFRFLGGEVDVSEAALKNAPMSSTGKSRVVASTSGFKPVAGSNVRDGP